MLSTVVEIWYGTLLFLGSIATLASLYSIILGRRFDRRVLESMERPRLGFQPHVCVIMPCKGHEPNLEENIDALLKQNYPSYHVMIVADSENDAAYKVADKILKSAKGSKAELLISTQHSNASGKVSALLTALEKNDENAKVFAFIDSDAAIHASWLADLVDPLGDPALGATTGFRWYFAKRVMLWDLPKTYLKSILEKK